MFINMFMLEFIYMYYILYTISVCSYTLVIVICLLCIIMLCMELTTVCGNEIMIDAHSYHHSIPPNEEYGNSISPYSELNICSVFIGI